MAIIDLLLVIASSALIVAISCAVFRRWRAALWAGAVCIVSVGLLFVLAVQYGNAIRAIRAAASQPSTQPAPP